MNDLDLLLLGALLGMLVVILLRPQTLVIPSIVASLSENSGCLVPLVLLGLLVLGLLFL